MSNEPIDPGLRFKMAVATGALLMWHPIRLRDALTQLTRRQGFPEPLVGRQSPPTLTKAQLQRVQAEVDRTRRQAPPVDELLSKLSAVHGPEFVGDPKSRDALARKAASFMLTGDSLEGALGKCNDKLRYSFLISNKRYVKMSLTLAADLRAHGAELIEETNYWSKPKGYRGLNTKWSLPVPGGAPGERVVFELTFATPKSHAAREATHPWYEKARECLDETLRRYYNDLQDAVFATVPIPHRARDLTLWPRRPEPVVASPSPASELHAAALPRLPGEPLPGTVYLGRRRGGAADRAARVLGFQPPRR